MERKTIPLNLSGVEPQRGQYRYTVKEREDGSPWIATEPAGVSLKIIGTNGSDLQIGFTLRPSTTLEEAHKVARTLARCMNDSIAEISLYQSSE